MNKITKTITNEQSELSSTTKAVETGIGAISRSGKQDFLQLPALGERKVGNGDKESEQSQALIELLAQAYILKAEMKVMIKEIKIAAKINEFDKTESNAWTYYGYYVEPIVRRFYNY